MSSAEYWKKRALEAKRLTAQEAEKTAAYVEHQYRLAMKDIDDRINLWYKRFAQDNGMTMIEAKKALNSQELKSFRMDVKRYIREGKAMNGRMDPSWMKRLRNAAAVHHIERFEAIKIQTQQAMEVLYGNQLDAIDELTKRTYENGYYHSLYSIQTKTGLGWTVNAIDKKKLATIISKPWAPDGESFSSRIWKNRAVAVNELHAALTQSCITGAPAERVAQQMAARLRIRASDAARLIRTESAHFAATGDRQAYKDTGVEQYQWIAGLDHTTCTLCQELDAHVFDLNEAEEGMTLPPRHPNCRCTTVPYFDDEFTVDETRAARDENGKTKQIPADMSYDDWEREFADGTAREEGHKGKFRSTEIARSRIESAEYGRRMSAVDSSRNVTNKITSEARKMLKHRNGTNYEDLMFIDTRTGAHITRTDFDKPRAVMPSKKMKKMLNEAPDYTVAAVHNHPGSTAPSPADIHALYVRKNAYGVVVCHDGTIYKYSIDPSSFNEAAYSSVFAYLDKNGYNNKTLSKFIDASKNIGVLIEVI